MGGRHRLEAEHRPSAALYAPMILFDPVVVILAVVDADHLLWASRSIAQAAFGIAGNDRLVVCLAAVDDDAIRSLMAIEGLP
jgi:hypothetical protein